MDAFDADVLIDAAVDGHPLGTKVRSLFPTDPGDAGEWVAIGSVLLVPELLAKPSRDGSRDELESLAELLGCLDLRPTDLATAELAAVLGAKYRLRALDAVHLATAVNAGATRFITNNSKDFPKVIVEIDVTYPGDL